MDESWPTAAKLSRWLRHSGNLSCGTVTQADVDLEHQTEISRLFFLTAAYSADAPADLPRRLVVKTPPVQANAEDYSPSELQFYREVAPVLASPPVVRCLAVVENEGTIVLEDLRATHDHPPWPIPPTKDQAEIAIDALAHVHGSYWEAPVLGKTIGRLHTVESLTSMVQGVAALLPAFFDAFADSLPTETREIYERVFASSLKPWLRLIEPHALTIIHGDAHTWNFLFPRAGSGPAYLIDWQLWHIDVGARDLAFLMALHLFPDRRRELETPLLRRYHDSLLAYGVANYSPADLWLDYRRCVVRNLTMPIIFWNRGMKPEGWWRRLECALAAYRDLDCDELL